MDLKKEAKRKIEFVKRRGMRGLLEAAGILKRKNDSIEALSFIMDEGPGANAVSADVHARGAHPLVVNWYMSDIPLISWNMRLLFALIGQLESPEIHNRVCLFRSQKYRSNEKAFRDFLATWYPGTLDGCEIVCDADFAPTSNVAIATNWQTAYAVNAVPYTDKKYYFLSHYETLEHPFGSFRSFIENSYDLGLKGICIGSYISSEISEAHDMTFYTLSLGLCSSALVVPAIRSDGNIRRIAFYANSGLSTYNYVLGMMALRRVCDAVPDIEVVYLGDEMSHRYSPASKSYDLGLLDLSCYSTALSQCDLLLDLSMDNPNQMPLVSMSVGAVPVLLNLPNNTWLFDDSVCYLADPEPASIAQVIIDACNNSDSMRRRRAAAGRFSRCCSWDAEVSKLKSYLLETKNDQ